MANHVAHGVKFPPIETAMSEPNGLLASGGSLSPETLINAYQHGIFPWNNPNEPLLWWSPDPRATLRPQDVHISRSVRKTMRRCEFKLSVNRAFSEVITACASSRLYSDETWINPDMVSAYLALHKLGYAHSVEVWSKQDQLIGGLYGLAIGDIFCGESMFHLVTDASKIAFIALCKTLQGAQYRLIDCQIENPHLSSLGVSNMPRDEFKRYLPAYSLHKASGCSSSYSANHSSEQTTSSSSKHSPNQPLSQPPNKPLGSNKNFDAGMVKGDTISTQTPSACWQSLPWHSAQDLANDLT